MKEKNNELNLDERSRKIFQAIVQNYIKTAKPVGSRNISRHYDLDISPATIRNVMNDLEEMGLITQPHTSAGRVPTHKGYRYFVDTLMSPVKLTKQEEKNIQTEYNAEKTKDFGNEIFSLTSKMLSVFSNYAGVATAPSISRSTIKKIEFISVSPKKILMVLITNSNFVKHKMIDLNEDLTSDELQSISNMFTDNFRNLSISDIKETIINKMEIEKPNYNELLKNAIIFAKNSLEKENEKNIYLEGAANILTHPEFAQIDKTKGIFKILEEKKNLSDIIEKSVETDGVKVFIGEETNISEMQDCSLVICSYKINNNPSGIIGIIGPTRMKYGKICSIVEFTSSQLEMALKNLIGES